MRRGFTLLEALAAVMTLGLLAAVVVPLLRQLGRQTIPDRIQAQAFLRTLASPESLAPGSALAVEGHPNWSLEIQDLAADPEPPPPPGLAPPAGPAHHWRWVSIHAAGTGEILAETVVVILDPNGRL